MDTADLLPPKTDSADESKSAMESNANSYGGGVETTALPPNIADLRADYLTEADSDHLSPPPALDRPAAPNLNLDLPPMDLLPNADPLAPPTGAEDPLGVLSVQPTQPAAPMQPSAASPIPQPSVQLAFGDDDPVEPVEPPKKKGLLSFLAGKPKPTPVPVPHAQPPSNAAQESKPTFIQKHKTPLAIAVALAGVMGWQYQQQIQQSALSALQQVSPRNDPYELALEEMQTAPTDISDAPALMLAGGDADLDIFSEGVDAAFPEEGAPNTEAPAEQAQGALPAEAGDGGVVPSALAQAAGVAAAAAIAQGLTDPGPAPAEPPIAKLTQELAETRQALEAARTEIDSLKGQLKAITEQKATPRSAPAKPVVRAAQKPAAKPVVASRQVTSRPAVAKPQATAAVRRNDIEFLGAFRDKGQIKAHALIGNTVIEVAQGQSVQGLKIEAVSMEGVTINGHQYR